MDLLIKNGFARADSEKLRLTPKGYALCDEIVAYLF
jgi:hypothetical protein